LKIYFSHPEKSLIRLGHLWTKSNQSPVVERGYLCRAIRGQGSGDIRNDNRDRTPPPVRLKALCGPDDDGSPCITVMMPDEN